MSSAASQAVKVFAQPAKKVIHHTHVSPLKEIMMGTALGLVAGFAWKSYHWEYMKKKDAWYKAVDEGKTSVMVDAAVEVEL